MCAGTLSVFDLATRRLVRTITISGSAKAMQITLAFSRDGQRFYLVETMLDRIADVEWITGKVLRRIAVGKNGDGLGLSGEETRPCRSI